ncbi:MAG: acyl-CoA dehydrogenase family protein [Alphaproteobacteria bacterium]|nr:acyl-CoA dehydrogenase family protein [Alphaproteobacteria bacterium]
MNQISRPDVVARARDVAPVIAAEADAIERAGRLTAPVLDALHEARLFRMLLPRAFGGDEVHPVEYARAVEEISRQDGSTGWCVFVGCSSSLLAAFMEPASAREIFADPRASVAWGPPGKPIAIAVPGGYRVSGVWPFASGCRHATWMGAHCQVREPDGSLRLHPSGRPLIRSLLFPADRARIIDDWNVMGLRGTASSSYVIEDVFVPEEFSATREDMRAVRTPGKLYSFSQMGLYSVGCAAVALGIARAMLDEFVAVASSKTPRGIVPLAQNPVVHLQLAQTEARLAASRAFLAEALGEAWTIADPAEPLGLVPRARVRLAAIHALQTAAEVGDYAYKAAGTDGIFVGAPLERRFRDLHTVSQQIQARLANFEPVGKVLLGQEPDGVIL